MKREILLKRNDLREKSICLRNIKFDESMKKRSITNVIEEQHKIYNKWKFYDNIIKAMDKKN